MVKLTVVITEAVNFVQNFIQLLSRLIPYGNEIIEDHQFGF
jgi:hypothetical protein